VRLNLGVSGAQVGDTATFATSGAVAAGVVFSIVGVATANQVAMNMCNFTASTVSLTSLPVHVMTFR
jgi:hypothetical protein